MKSASSIVYIGVVAGLAFVKEGEEEGGFPGQCLLSCRILSPQNSADRRLDFTPQN